MLLMSHIAVPAFHETPVVHVVEDGYRLRLVAFGFGFVAAAVVMPSTGESLILPLLLALNACIWPGLARAFALRSSDPHAIETRNLLIDSAFGGAWVALMQFNLLPCVLLTVVLTCDKAIAGGWGLLWRGLIVQAAACVLVLALHGLSFAPQTSTSQILASLPLLVVYPFMIALRLRNRIQQTDSRAAEAEHEYTAPTGPDMPLA